MASFAQKGMSKYAFGFHDVCRDHVAIKILDVGELRMSCVLGSNLSKSHEVNRPKIFCSD